MRGRVLAILVLAVGGHTSAGEPPPYAQSRGAGGAVARLDAVDGKTWEATIVTPGRPPIRVPPRESLPPPRLRWLSADLLRIDYGSELGADVASIFYSVRRNAIDGPYQFVKVVDPLTERILLADESLVVQRLFRGDGGVPLTVPGLNRAALKWFVVSSESRFDGDRLILKFLLEPTRRGEEKWVRRVIALPRSGAGRERDGAAGAPLPRIRALVRTTNTDIEAGRATRRVFWSDVGGDGAWHVLKPPGSGRASTAHDLVATVHEVDGRVTKVVIETTSPSGDWRNTTEYWFRPSGRTAFRYERHFTFLGPAESDAPGGSGPFVIERRLYLDEAGRELRRVERALSERSHRALPAERVQHVDLDVYRNVAELPFAALLD